MLFMLSYINTNTLYIMQSEIEIQVLDEGLDFAVILKPSYKKILKVSPGECIFDGSSEISLLKIFLIKQCFAQNLTGNLHFILV